MKTFVTLVLCSSLFLVGGDAFAKKARARHERSRPDEVVLSTSLVRELQTRLKQAGYPPGTIDGHLNRRTRVALADFQRDYHVASTGVLDRWTAEALLGRERLRGFLLANN